jgi:hypothetical protein
MSQSVENQATLLTQFADGQAAGSITPQDVRNVIVSVPYLAGNQQVAPITSPTVGSGGAVTIDVEANGSVQSIGFATGYTQLTVGITPTGLGANVRVYLELYVTQNNTGTGTISFAGSGAAIYGVYVPQLGPANYVTRFVLVSLDGGSSWSIVS